MSTAHTPFTGDNKHRCCKVQVVTNLWPAVVVQSNNFACGKLGSSNRKCHAMFKNWKSWLMWEEMRVSTVWGLSTDLTWWLEVVRTDDRSLPSQTRLWSSRGSRQALSPYMYTSKCHVVLFLVHQAKCLAGKFPKWFLFQLFPLVVSLLPTTPDFSIRKNIHLPLKIVYRCSSHFSELFLF